MTGTVPGRTGDRPKGPNFLLAGFGLSVLLGFGLLYELDREDYFSFIDLWSFHPFQYPFIDLLFIDSQIDCWHMGIDVYSTNPCDPLGRLHDYSPLWLRMTFLPGKEWTLVSGAALDAAFMLSLAALPRWRTPKDAVPLLLGVVSPMAVFALERGNVDVAMFVMTMVAVIALEGRLAVRAAGYAVVMLASLLKFYPFVLFALLVRERIGLCLVLGFVAAGCMGAYVFDNFLEISHMVANVPQPPDFTDAFGAVQLPDGIGLALRGFLAKHGVPEPLIFGTPAGRVLKWSAWFGLLAGTVAAVRFLTRTGDLRSAVRALAPREASCLAAGALLTVGCFFAGRSVGYREVCVLMTLPGLLALGRFSRVPTLARICRIAAWVATFLMWCLVPQRAISVINERFLPLSMRGGYVPPFTFWLFRELCWWCFIALLASILLSMVPEARAWRDTVRWLEQLTHPAPSINRR